MTFELYDFLRSYLNYITVYFIAIAPLLLFVFSNDKNKDYSGLLYLMTFTMIYNTILKFLFKLPLPETCPAVGYGFPSGHMNLNSVFYVWLIIHTKNIRIKFIFSIILILIGYATVFAGYHYIKDVIAALICSIICVYTYKKYIEKYNKERTFCIISVIFMLMLLNVFYITKDLYRHVLLAYYFVLGFGAIYIIDPKNKLKKSTKIIILSSFALITFLDSRSTETLYHILERFKWLFIGITVSALQKIRQKKSNKSSI